MAKRNTKQGMYQPRQPQYPDRRKPGGKGAAKPASKAARASGARPASKAAPAAAAPSATTEPIVLRVRIAAVAVLLAALIGGIAWVISLNGVFSNAEILAFIGLAFAAGLALLVAIRTPAVVDKVLQFKRERG